MRDQEEEKLGEMLHFFDTVDLKFDNNNIMGDFI